MKHILTILFLIISLTGFGQISNLEVKNIYIKDKIATPVRIAYSGDTARIYFQGDSVIFYTDKSWYYFNKPIQASLYRQGVDTLTTIKALRDSVIMLLDSIADLRGDIGGSSDSIINKSVITNVAITGSSQTNKAIVGNSDTEDAINGNSTDGVGIYGTSTNNDAIYGLSTNSNGVFGVTNSSSNAGGYFYAYTGLGLKAISQSGTIGLFANNTNDSISIKNDATIHQYYNGSQVFSTNTSGIVNVTGGYNLNGSPYYYLPNPLKLFDNGVNDTVLSVIGASGAAKIGIFRSTGSGTALTAISNLGIAIIANNSGVSNIANFDNSVGDSIVFNKDATIKQYTDGVEVLSTNSDGTIQTTGGLVTGDSIKPGGRLLIPMGEVSYFNTTGTTITISGTSNGSTNMVVVNPTTTLNNDMDFDNGGSNNGRLRYTGTTTRTFHVACSISFTGAVTNNDGVFGIAKNGTVVPASKVISFLGLTTDTRSTALHIMVELATNDYLELYVGNMTASNNVVVKTLNLFAMGM